MKNGRFFHLMTFVLLLSLLLTPLTARAFDDGTQCPASRTRQHSWAREEHRAPTCTSSGVEIYRCKWCGKVVRQAIPPWGTPGAV